VISLGKAKNHVDLVMVSFNSRPFLPGFFKSLQKNTKYPFQLFVIDNNSIDGSKAYLQTMLKKKFFNKKMKLTINRKNIGLAKAWNKAITFGQSEYIVFLNPDIIFTKNWLTKLIKSADKYRKAMVVGVKVLNPDGAIYHAGAISRPRGRGLQNRPGLYDREKKLRLIQGSCFLVKRAVFAKIGKFDEQFFVYGEEADFCRRVRKAGFHVLYSPVPIYHFRHGSEISSQKRLQLRKTSAKLLKNKWSKK
jgi:GT2 family glycosyltransferase